MNENLAELTLCVCVISATHLHPDLGQVDLHGQLLPAVHIWIVRLLERSLQLVQLEGGERGSIPTVLLLRVFVVGQFAFVSVRRIRTHGGFGCAAGAAHTCRDEEKKFNNNNKNNLIIIRRRRRRKAQFSISASD